MSANRKAELQRKLAMAPVAKPPAGLAERIKSEIPPGLKWDAEKERRRFSQSIAFNLRVAASILLLISSVYLALRVLSRYEPRPTAIVTQAARVETKSAPRQTAATPAPPKPIPAAAAEEAPRQIAQAQPVMQSRRRDETAPPPPVEVPTQAVAEAAPRPAPAAPLRESETVTAEAPVLSERAAAKTQSNAAAAGVAGGMVPEARAADLALAPSTMFGVSLKSAVQQFAAPPDTPDRVRLEVEAVTLDDQPTLRVSIDTPSEAHPAGGSRPPAAADARLDIAFNPKAVASQRPLVGPIASSAPALPSSESVTALYGVELKPDIGRRTLIATVTLHYRDVATGKQRTLTGTIRRADIRAWEDASRRTKSAVLAEAITSRQLPLDDIIARANAAGLTDVAAYAEQQKE